MAQSEGKISETNLQIIQVDEEMRAEVMKELRENQAKVSELVERKVAAEDQLKRIDIRSPSDGYVHQLAVHTVGGVISPAEPAMLIVPVARHPRPRGEGDAAGHRPARHRPEGERARPRRERPHHAGAERHASAASPPTSPRTSRPASATTRSASRIPPEELKHLGHLKLVAGMQAEVFVQTHERTPFEYLIKPLKDQIARTFRET